MSRNTDKKKTKRSQNKANTTTLGEATGFCRLYPFSLQELMIRVS